MFYLSFILFHKERMKKKKHWQTYPNCICNFFLPQRQYWYIMLQHCRVSLKRIFLWTLISAVKLFQLILKYGLSTTLNYSQQICPFMWAKTFRVCSCFAFHFMPKGQNKLLFSPFCMQEVFFQRRKQCFSKTETM